MTDISPYLRWSSVFALVTVFILFLSGALGPSQYNVWPAAGVALLYWTMQGVTAWREQNTDDIRTVLAMRRATTIAFWLVPVAILCGGISL